MLSDLLLSIEQFIGEAPNGIVARNIKPAFFDNDELAENDPLGRLLFIGLWTPT